MEQMLSLDDQTIKKFGENGRKKIEFEFDENLVISKYLQEISTLKAAV
jgi:hypothetical protein